MSLKNSTLLTRPSSWRRRNQLTLITVIFYLVLTLSPDNGCKSLHIQGNFHTNDFFLFLSKFGFQQTEFIKDNRVQSQGYIYGNITNVLDDGKHPFLPTTSTTTVKPSTSTTTTSTVVPASSSIPASTNATSSSTSKTNEIDSTSKTNETSSSIAVPSSTEATMPTIRPEPLPTPQSSRLPRSIPPNAAYPATLVAVHRSYFLDFYRLRDSREDPNTICQMMFQGISSGNGCSAEAKENFHKYLRHVPCSKNGVCPDETDLNTLVEGSQFTFPIMNKNEAKFWYLTLVSCYFDESKCKWQHSAEDTTVHYDIWLVNGNPYKKSENPLENQFSFDRQDTVEIYLVFFVGYLILFPIQIHAVLRQRHIVPKLFTSSVTLELGAVMANVVDVLKYAVDGQGYPKLAVFGDILDILARAIFMLILLVLAKGWAVTRTELTGKPFIFTIWIIYSVVHILLYIWNQTEVDVIEDIDEYQTWPGWLILILRTIIMMWFVYELKDTMDHEHQPHKLNFFLHFGAQALVWFIYLPIVALIALQVSPLWRSKLLLGITYSADFFAFAVMTHLLFPTRSQQYLLLTANKIDSSVNDELEEFNEAPHVVNPYASRRTNNRVRINYAINGASTFDSNSLLSFNNNTTSNSNGIHNNSFFDNKDNVPLIRT